MFFQVRSHVVPESTQCVTHCHFCQQACTKDKCELQSFQSVLITGWISKDKGCSPVGILWGLQDAPVPGWESQLQGWGQQGEELEKEDLFWVYNTDAEHSDMCPIEDRASYNLEIMLLTPGLPTLLLGISGFHGREVLFYVKVVDPGRLLGLLMFYGRLIDLRRDLK